MLSWAQIRKIGCRSGNSIRIGFARRAFCISPAQTEAKPLPLAGVRVLELASVLAGPSVCQFLAELGADVMKVENIKTSGDVTRGWRLPGEQLTSSAISAYFSSCNLGKRSIALDAGAAQGRDIIKRLANKSDIVVASYKPGDAEKFGFDAKSLRSEKPSLIYAQITGYGLESPRVGYDALIQAESGFTFMNGEAGPDRQPTKMPVALVDVLASHQLKEAILLAMLQRQRTGEGAHVHVSLMGAAVSSLVNQATGFLRAGKIPQRMGSEHPSICPYGNAFEDKHGQLLVLAVGADSQFRNLCAVLGRPELGIDARYAKNVSRVAHRGELLSLLTDLIRQHSRAELLEQLEQKKVPAGAIADMQSVFETPQAEALVVRDRSGTDALGLRQVAWRGDGVAAHSPAAPPGYGQHTAEILTELGLGQSEIKQLIDAGVAGEA